MFFMFSEKDYIQRGKSARASVEKNDMDLYKQWVDMYNTAVTMPNKLNQEKNMEQIKMKRSIFLCFVLNKKCVQQKCDTRYPVIRALNV